MTGGFGTRWFARRGWTPFPFQRAVWRHARRGAEGLIHAATGTGKTYAAWFAALDTCAPLRGGRDTAHPSRRAGLPADGLRLIWITPMRALAADLLKTLKVPLTDLNLPLTVEVRTGDTSSSVRQRQRRRMPHALITTPESLSRLLSEPESSAHFHQLTMIVVDEWHELMGTKRGVQTELALARLRAWNPGVRTWALSATIGNLAEGLHTVLGAESGRGVVVEGRGRKSLMVDALIPERMERFPWSGHLGGHLVDEVAAEVRQATTALLFTNTRSQAESWYQLLLEACPELAGAMAVHHGSLSAETRRWVEDQLRTGALRCVVSTASLDLGVDFPTVDRVFQIGSPKAVSRLMQRAGRSGHRPGAQSRITIVPTHAFELVEAAAARDATRARQIEARPPLIAPLDVLAQHVVSVACGGGFDPDALYGEVRRTAAYETLSRTDWDWVLAFVSRGGPALAAYPDFHKIASDAQGRWVPVDPSIARRHRLSIGTIVSDSTMRVQYVHGPLLGTIEERFIAGLQPGQAFIFGGTCVCLALVRDMTAWVRAARGVPGAIPSWAGTRLPFSPVLSTFVRARLDAASRGVYRGPEMKAVRPVLETQRRVSAIPTADELLIETLRLRDGYHVYIYPFEGVPVHEALATLLAYRLSRVKPQSLTTIVTDYGLELHSPDPIDLPAVEADIFSIARLTEDVEASVNAAELARRQFREIARIVGLVLQGERGRVKSSRQLQASAGLIYDVLARYDPDNRLVAQAHREALEIHAVASRLPETLTRLSQSRRLYVTLSKGSPLSFPILTSHLRRNAVSSESMHARIRTMQRRLEQAVS